MRQLTSLDAQFLAIETPRAFGHVGGLAVYDPALAPGGELTIGDVCRRISERMHLLPPFQQKLVTIPLGLDHPYWIEDPDFDIDFHVREIGLAPPGNFRQLAEQVARIMARPLDRSRPLWELYLIRGLEGGRDAMLTKFHHSAIDGVSGNEILAVLLDHHAEGREVPPPKRDRAPEPSPSDLELLGRALLGLPRRPLALASALPAAVANLDALPGVERIPGMRMIRRAALRARRAVARLFRGRRPRWRRPARAHREPGSTAPSRHTAVWPSGRCRWRPSRRSRTSSGLRSTTSSSLYAPRCCAPGSRSGASCPMSHWWRWFRCPCGPRRKPAASATGSRPCSSRSPPTSPIRGGGSSRRTRYSRWPRSDTTRRRPSSCRTRRSSSRPR